MTENEAKAIIKKNYPKCCKTVNGRYKGGFDDTDCELGQAFNIAIKALEEFRAAVEKQTAKRALHQGCYDKNGEWHEWNGINGKPYELCPNCRANLCCETPLDIKPKYCPNCGQKLDWRNEE